MSIPKRHHTAPRVYLENFVDQDGRLTIKSKRHGNNLRPKPKNALTRHHYYSQPVSGIENADQKLETVLFNKIETQYPTLYASLTKDAEPVDKKVLIQTILSMHIRSPGFREAFEIGLANLVDRRLKAMPKSFFPPPPKGLEDILEKVAVTIDPHRSLHAMEYYLNKYAKILDHFSYQLYSAPKGMNFLTSDNPVVWFESRYGKETPNVFSFDISLKTRVTFAISPKKTLVGKLSKTGDFEIKTRQKTASRQQVREFNEIQLACAWDQVIGRISLPKNSIDRLSNLAPKFFIEEYNPENGHFHLSSIELAAIEKKHKHRSE